MIKRNIVYMLMLCLLAGCGSDLTDVWKNAPQSQKVVDPEGNVSYWYAPNELPQIIELELVQQCRDKYFEEQRREDELMRNLLTKENIDPTSIGHYMLYKSNKVWSKTVSNVMGKSDSDICKPGTNQWDAYIAEVKEKNETVRIASSDGFNVLKWGIGGWTLSNLFKNAGDDISGGSNKVTSGDSSAVASRDLSGVSIEKKVDEKHQSGNLYSTQTASTDSCEDGACDDTVDTGKSSLPEGYACEGCSVDSLAKGLCTCP